MKIALCILIILFGGLSMLAAITQLKAARNRRSPMVMTVGSALLLLAVLFLLLQWKADWILALAGNILICGSALYNGLTGDNFHLQHHIVRITLSLVLTAGFFFL